MEHKREFQRITNVCGSHSKRLELFLGNSVKCLSGVLSRCFVLWMYAPFCFCIYKKKNMFVALIFCIQLISGYDSCGVVTKFSIPKKLVGTQVMHRWWTSLMLHATIFKQLKYSKGSMRINTSSCLLQTKQAIVFFDSVFFNSLVSTDKASSQRGD